MKKNFIIVLLAFISVNLLAFIVLYYLYFPWMSSIDSQEVENTVLADVRELNYRLSILDYDYSPKTIARAEWELEAEITTSELSEVELSKDSKQELIENRYLVFMDGESGPTGHIMLKDNKTVLTLGPYDDAYNDIVLKDYLVYFLILMVFNGLVLYLNQNFLQRKLRPAAFALDTINLDNLVLAQKNNHILYLSENLPNVVKHVQGITKNYQQSIHSQRDLMHAVAHEFRGPMARLSFAMDLLDEATNDAKKLELRHDMQESLDELDSLVTEVLGYSRLKDGQHPLELSEFNILDVVQVVQAKVQKIYADKRFVINIKPSEGINLEADESLIERSLINLVRNAAKFSRSLVEISIKQHHKTLEIKIEDDGPGIPPGKRERVFEPFTRLDYSRNRDSGGAGLGLAIVQSICNRHQGDISASDSKTLGGALFTLSIPLRLSPENEAKIEYLPKA